MALFACAVLGAVAGVDGVLALLYHAWAHLRWYFGADTARWPPWPTVAWMTAVQLAGIGVAAGYRITQLREGGWVVAQDLGGIRVPADTTESGRRRLLNVVEEMAIASNVPVPDVYVMEDEPGINAFIAGYAAADAVVCMTRGCIDQLTRDELQGVVAHEFAHVLNGDIRLDIRMIGLLHGIGCINLWGHRLVDGALATRATDEGQQAGYAVALMLGILAIAVGAFGAVWARLAQAGVARSRERLADASALRLTRNDRGLIGALRKAATTPAGSTLLGARRQEIAHMSFADVGGYWGLFATHPTLQSRLETLGTRWDRADIARLRKMRSVRRSASIGAPSAAPGHLLAEPAATPGEGGNDAPVAAGATEDALAPELLWAAYDPHRADDVLLALAISRDASTRATQLGIVRKTGGRATDEAVRRLLPLIESTPAEHRLPLAFRTFPALRQMPRDARTSLLTTVMQLARADRRIDLHEYCLLRALAVQMRDMLDPTTSARPGTRSLQSCREDFVTACAVVAARGNPDNEPAAASAFRRAVEQAMPGCRTDYRTPSDWQPALDRALAQLARLRPTDRQRTVLGLAAAINSDGINTVAERELLRVICAHLRCPLPLLRGPPAVAPW